MLAASWDTLCQLAPWLLLGMLLSSTMHVLLPADFIRRKFQGLGGIIKSVLFGVPLPLCSCGVIPAGIGLKNQGASDGASVGFLISTPQTGVDSILVSATFFGWPFALFKMISAAVMGVVGGILADYYSDRSIRAVVAEQATARKPASVTRANGWREFWDHGFEIIRSIWIWIVIGILISAAIQVMIPNSWIEGFGAMGLLPSMLLVLLISTPLYVCATASVPIAAALVVGGLPPAAALVFLMAGPATNVTTMGAIKGRFGWRIAIVYLATVIVGSMSAAYLFDWLLSTNVVQNLPSGHEHQNWWSIGSAIILLSMMSWFAWQEIQHRLRQAVYQRSKIDGEEQKLELEVSGMTCSGCANRLQKGLTNLVGADLVNVDLVNELAVIYGDVSEEDALSKIRSLGFEVKR